jgi:hypothetical protein
MASVDAQALQQDRQGDRGSDETALQERRRIQKLIRTGDEHVIPELILSLSAFLGAKTVEESKGALPAAIVAAQGLGKLCDPSPSQIELYETPLSTKKVTAEQLLVFALKKGNNRLQSAAADALGLIGTPRFSMDDLRDREQFDKSASVKARCKMAIRRINQRNKPQGISIGEIDLVILSACTAAGIDIKTKEKGLFKVVVDIEMANQDNRTQNVEIKSCLDERTLASGTKIELQYLCISTVCGPANEQMLKTAMKLNSSCMNPDDIQHDYEFVQGSLAIRGSNLVMLQSLPVNLVTADLLRQSIFSIANSGDEIEKILCKGGDSH